MEEKKNNAVEKVENIVNGKVNDNDKPLTEEERAKARIEEAKRVIEQEAIKDKEKATALRQKNKLKEDRRKMRLARVQAQIDRKQMLRDKSVEERQSLERLERQAKIEQRAFDRREKARLKREKAQREFELKVQRAKDRQKNKEKNRGYGGWLAAVITLAISTIALATALTLTYLMPQEADLAMESVYSKSFYEAVEQVDNIDLNLSKTLATKDTGAMQTYLVDLAINSELAESDIQQLPLQDESKYYTTKLINQIGDFAKYLNKKLINGESPSQEDRQNLLSLYNSNLAVKDSLQNMMQKMTSDYSFSSMVDGGNGNLVIENFNELQNLSVQYPELIYDGPFSDGANRKEIKGLNGAEITKAEAKEIFTKIFAEYGLKDVDLSGETTADIEAYNVIATSKGQQLFAQISKKGGKLVMFAYAGSCDEVNFQDDSAVQKAEEFLTGLGISNMKAVWINLANNVYTINFAYEQNGVIVYSDLIKVRVCAETNTVIGIEASSYWTNHTQRSIASPVLAENTAKSKVSDNISVLSSRLAVVPVGQTTEKLCYEFSGEFNDTTYYVYIDAITGKQVELFKVIASTEGMLLM